MSACNTGFHHRCEGGCGCLCHTPSPKPASDHVALQASIDNGTTQIFMIDGVEHFRTVNEDGEVTVTTL